MSAYTYPSVVIQSYMTFTAVRWGQFPSITFSNGALAGSEVVTVTGTSNVNVQIQSGVTTMLQVKNAILAHRATSGFNASDLVSMVITATHNSDVVKAAVNATLAGGITASGSPSGPLGRAGTFAVLGDTAVTNTGNTVLTGDLGISPGSSITGFPPGTYTGALHQTDTAAANAHTDATAAAVAFQAMGPGTDISSTDLNGFVATPGVYSASSTGTWTATGDLTLNGAGTYVFLFGTALTMGADCHVVLTNGATADKVFFVTGTAFTFGANCTMRGSILAGTSITFASNSVMYGSALTYGPSGTTVTFPSAGIVTAQAGPIGSTFAGADISGVRYTAVASGSAGNAISINYTDGAVPGSEIVSVIGNAITVQVADAETILPIIRQRFSDARDIITAVNAFPAAAALVTATLAITGDQFATYADAAEPRYLSGGLDGVAASVVLQDITISSHTMDATQNGTTITYTSGATAGAEVVSGTNPSYNVQIQSGVSTATQVAAALNAYAGFSSLYVALVTGTGSNPQVTVNQVPMAGAVARNVLGYFMDQNGTVLTTTFQTLFFDFAARYCTIINDETSGTKAVIFSWDGINNHGILYPGQSMMIDTVNANVIYLKEANGAPAYRIMAKAF